MLKKPLELRRQKERIGYKVIRRLYVGTGNQPLEWGNPLSSLFVVVKLCKEGFYFIIILKGPKTETEEL